MANVCKKFPEQKVPTYKVLQKCSALCCNDIPDHWHYSLKPVFVSLLQRAFPSRLILKGLQFSMKPLQSAIKTGSLVSSLLGM